VRETARAALRDDSLARSVDTLKALMWPDGQMRPKSAARSAADRERARKEAGVLLGLLVPDLAGSVVGKGNAQAASRKLVGVVNNERLNTHLVFTLVDEVMKIVFSEVMD